MDKDEDGEYKYQVGALIYDYSKYNEPKIGIQYECMLLVDVRVDLSVSDDNMTIEKFEGMSKVFNETMRNHIKRLKNYE
jgi:hypothetical protein